MDTVNKIMQFESGTMEVNDTVDFFAELVKSGMAWTLQGSYGRGAKSLIDQGFISESGEVLTYPE